MLKKLFKILKGGLELNQDKALKGNALKHILISAMYAHQQVSYLNSYETGVSKNLRLKILNQYWSIYDKDSAIKKLNYLLNEGYVQHFEVVYNAFIQRNADYVSIIENASETEEDLAKIVEMFRNLQEGYPQLVEDKVITQESDLQHYGVSSWDLGRGVYIARLAWEEGFITMDELKSYAESAYQKLKQDCNTWQDYTKSYIIGRAIWNPNSDNSGMVSIAQELLTHENSPIKGGGAI